MDAVRKGVTAKLGVLFERLTGRFRFSGANDGQPVAPETVHRLTA
jgi:hypothetical protein